MGDDRISTRPVIWGMGVLTVAAVAMLAPRAARAAGPHRAYYVPLSHTPRLTQLIPNRISQLMRSHFARLREVELLDDTAFEAVQRERAGRKGHAAIVNTAIQKYRIARNLASKKNKKALKPASGAFELFRANALRLNNHQQLIDAQVLLAYAYYLNAYEDNMVESLEEVLRLRPRLTLKGRYPGAFKRAFRRTQKRINRFPRGSLHVASDPPKAQVYVNGRLRGATPVKLDDLIAGTHYLRLVSKDRQPAVRKVMVKARSAGRLSVKLQKPGLGGVTAANGQSLVGDFRKELQVGSFGGKLNLSGQILADGCGAQHLISGYLGKSAKGYKLQLFVFEASSARFAATEEVQFDADLSNMAPALQSVEQQAMAYLQKFPPDKLVADKPPIYEEPGAQPAVVVATPPSAGTTGAAAQKPAAVATTPPKVAEKPPKVAEKPPKVAEKPPKVAEKPPKAADKPPAATTSDTTAKDYRHPFADQKSVQEPDKTSAPPPLPVVEQRPSRSTKWYKTWWFWTIVGVTVAGATTAGLLLAQPSAEEPSSFKATATWK